jgi:chemotaxis signal transduction protein
MIALDAVAEVARVARPRLIPLVPLEIAGIVNLRGEPVPVIDGGALLQGSPVPPYEHVLLLESKDDRVGMLVDAVSRIERGGSTKRTGEQEEPTAAPFVTRALLEDGEVGVVEVAGLFARARELLGGTGLTRGETGCQSAF